MKKKLFIVVNVDWFFLSHRLPIAQAAKEKGYDVTVLAYDTGKSDEIKSYGLDFIHIPFKRSGTNILHELRCLNILRQIYTTYKPDLIHHVTIKVALYGSIAARLSSITGVVNAISGLGYSFTDNRSGIMKNILLTLMRFGFKSSRNHFIFQNMDDVAVFKGLNIVMDKQVSLIKGSGVDLNQFREEVQLKTDKISVLLTARMLYDKGIIEYIEAAKLLKDKFDGKVQFLLAGDVDRENLASINEKDLLALTDGNYIKWMGFQSDIFTLLKQSDIVVLPSYREGLPKSLIEAAAVGRPIVTTNVPGCKECVIEGYNGFLVPEKNAAALANAMEKLLLDPALRIQFGRNSRTLAEKEFSIDGVVNKTLKIYQDLVD